MDRIVVMSTVGSDGVLQLTLPMGLASAESQVQVTVEPVAPQAPTPDEWRQLVLDTAGKWEGPFERSEQGTVE